MLTEVQPKMSIQQHLRHMVAMNEDSYKVD